MPPTPLAAPRPRQPAPALTVPLLSGETFDLAARSPEHFTMVVFFRGLHCPVCQGQLRELDRRLGELAERGIEVVAVSGETEERTQQLHDEWKLGDLALGHSLTEEAMRRWGLFISTGIGDAEPAQFNEPGLFLVTPDAVLYYASILSMPVGRPKLDELLGGIDFWTENDYPARGEA